MITTDRVNPSLKVKKENGQNEAYLVLTEEEISKGFVRPLRSKYVHVGKKLNYKGIHRMLDPGERKEYDDKYVAIMTILVDEDGKFQGGPYVTQEELDAWKEGKEIGGCGTETVISSREIVETYARNPHFYGATFCCGCGKHLPVEEFVWEGTDERVGS